MRMKKRKKVLIVIGIIILFLAAVPFAINKYKKMKVLAGISNEDYILFSNVFCDGDSGTFKYYISDGRIEKVSSYTFYDFSYSEDRKRIVGFVNQGDFRGLAELELEDNKFNLIISINEINTLLSNMGLDEFGYKNERRGNINSLRPKYYKSGYTFYSNAYDFNTLVYIEKNGSTWNMEKLYETDGGIWNYFIEEGGEEDTLFLAIEEERYRGEGGIIKKRLSSGKEEVLFKLRNRGYTFKRGRMDMTEDKSKIVYCDYPHIYIYNLETEQVENTITIKLDEYEDVKDLKFSPNGKYLFYTVEKEGLFIGSATLRLTFHIVNLETMESVKLKKWEYNNSFFGIDW